MKRPELLVRQQIERNISSLKKFSFPRPAVGWIRYMRIALSMSTQTLAKRVGLSANTVTELQKREVEERVTLRRLRSIADAMDCDLAYAFVPRKSIDSILKENAEIKAARLVDEAHLHMELEGQAVKESKRKRTERVAKKLIDKGDVW